jgi:deazaflavin-dependent oxidoreductase (nitroreductase family)
MRTKPGVRPVVRYRQNDSEIGDIGDDVSESTTQTESWNDGVIAQFRAGEKRIANMFDRSSLLLLHTTGARSGQPRTTPLAYFADGDRLLIIGSAAGRDAHPAWYFNLLANPQVKIELWADDAIDSFEAIATPAEGEERDRLFAQVVAVAPGFGDYQSKTSRLIPVVTLQRI